MSTANLDAFFSTVGELLGGDRSKSLGRNNPALRREHDAGR